MWLLTVLHREMQAARNYGFIEDSYSENVNICEYNFAESTDKNKSKLVKYFSFNQLFGWYSRIHWYGS